MLAVPISVLVGLLVGFGALPFLPGILGRVMGALGAVFLAVLALATAGFSQPQTFIAGLPYADIVVGATVGFLAAGALVGIFKR